MQEHDPTAIDPTEKPLEGGDVAEPSSPQEADLPKPETDPPKESQQAPTQDSGLQTPQPDQPHPPVSDQDDGRGSD